MKHRVWSAIAALTLALAIPLSAPAQAEMTLQTLSAPAEVLAKYPYPFNGSLMKSTFTNASTVVALAVKPDTGILNDPFTVTGSGLTPNTSYSLAWNTTDAAWLGEVDPTTANFRGTKYTKINVEMGKVTTDASGAFTFQTKVPADFGNTHDIYLVKDDVAVAKGGFEVMRSVSMSPTKGPIGTPITITYTGMGASLYTAGAAINYDNDYMGQFLALWTRGTGTAVIRAAGRPGKHFVHVMDAIEYQYMNILQSPVPHAMGQLKTFTVTKDPGVGALKPSMTWPMTVTPAVKERTTISTTGDLAPSTSAVAKLTPDHGPILQKVKLNVTGLPDDGNVDLVWSTVVGSRVDCPVGSTQCWKFNGIPMSTGTVKNGTLDAELTIPDNLGGYHVVQVKSGNKVLAQASYYVQHTMWSIKDKNGKDATLGVGTADVAKAQKSGASAEDLGGVGVGTYNFKAGEAFTITVRGVGWTQFDNTMAVTYDNSHVGYGCGFNSNGYMAIHMVATGEPGTHIIDLWPQLYTHQPSFANTQYGMVPLLSGGWDSPALALGYTVPVIHFAINVTK